MTVLEIFDTEPTVGRLDLPCARGYGIRRNSLQCLTADDGHGHVVLVSDDGLGFVPAPIYSRPFLMIVLETLHQRGIIDTSVVDTVLQQAASLAETMNEFEAHLAAYPQELDQYLRFLWC